MKNKRIPIYITLLICFAIPSVYANSARYSKNKEDALLRKKIESCIDKDEASKAITPERTRMYRSQIDEYFNIHKMLSDLKEEFLLIRTRLVRSFLKVMGHVAIVCFSVYGFLGLCYLFLLHIVKLRDQPMFDISLHVFFKKFFNALLWSELVALCYKLYQLWVYKTMSSDKYKRYLLYDYLVKKGIYHNLKKDKRLGQIIKSGLSAVWQHAQVIMFLLLLRIIMFSYKMLNSQQL